MDTMSETQTGMESAVPGSTGTAIPTPIPPTTPPKRKRGRPRKYPLPEAPNLDDIERAARGEPPRGQPAAPEATPENVTVETVIGLIQLLLVFAGEEEGVLKTSEKLMIRPGLERLLRKYEIGADTLPAEVEVLMGVSAIVIERIKLGGKTATAFAKGKAWLARWLFKARGAQVGSIMRKEVPTDLVEKLKAQVERLNEELRAVRATPVNPEPGA